VRESIKNAANPNGCVADLAFGTYVAKWPTNAKILIDWLIIRPSEWAVWHLLIL
jgi:hypothetical protein